MRFSELRALNERGEALWGGEGPNESGGDSNEKHGHQFWEHEQIQLGEQNQIQNDDHEQDQRFLKGNEQANECNRETVPQFYPGILHLDF